MQKEDVLTSLASELRRGTIVLCVLGVLKEPMYGYSLITALAEAGVPAEANTLYPLLRRLEGQGLLESRWETGENKPRKYYTVTPEGREIYHKLKGQWDATVRSVDGLLAGEDV